MNAIPFHRPVRVKICGITNPPDAEAAIDAGADALGFNGFAGSRRFLDLRAAAPWISRLPALVARVAVLVNPSAPESLEISALPGIDLVQFHGDEPPAFCAAFARANALIPGGKTGLIKALAARDADVLRLADAFVESTPTVTLLLDAYVPGAYGGTGSLINLELAAAAAQRHPRLILSGGLTPENVTRAVRAVRPYAVDVASGVESAPGQKDRAKMRDFIAAAKSA